MRKYTQTILTIIMFGIVLASGTLLISVWLLPPTEFTPSIALLNESMQAGPYPTNVTVNTNITLNIEVSNYMGVVQYFYVRMKLADETTMATATTPSTAPTIQQFERLVANGGTWRFPVTLNMTTPGINYRLTFELWHYDPSTDEIIWIRDALGRGLWVHLPMNVTGP
jgi:uncharacterized membrane protein